LPRTERIRLGTAVVVLPWHNPALSRKSGDPRFIVERTARFRRRQGLSALMNSLASACPRRSDLARFDERSRDPQGVDQQGRFSYDGTWWHYDNIVVEPAPIQQPHPPLWLGAGSAESIRRRRAKATICCSTKSPRST